MSYKKIEIKGLRGFSDKQTLNFGLNSGQLGSGLTVIVGPNNSGKSTIFESIRAISQNDPPSFTEGKRNKKSGDTIEISLYKDDNVFLTLKTTGAGGSETSFEEKGLTKNSVNVFSLPSRRTFSPYFNKSQQDRGVYIGQIQLNATRGSNLDSFAYRLFNIQKSAEQLQNFNKVLAQVLEPTPKWHIDQADSGSYYIKFVYADHFHNSDGAGEGLLSLFTIVDALYDSIENDVIIIDEPELSLHPSLQRKLNQLLIEYAATRQIIISTHSPYFISWTSLNNGGQLARTQKAQDGSIKVNQLSGKTIKGLQSLSNNNLNNPHVIGLEAKEVFFLDDQIVLVEGQEDVVFLRRVCSLLGISLKGSFYGWGAGGAQNIPIILNLFKDLGFKKVAIVLDKNMSELAEKIKKEYIDYLFVTIPTDDIRDKEEIKPKAAIEGLVDRGGKEIKEKYIEATIGLLSELKKYL
jgi:predicted ATP-dependent endonuclease of OLD family